MKSRHNLIRQFLLASAMFVLPLVIILMLFSPLLSGRAEEWLMQQKTGPSLTASHPKPDSNTSSGSMGQQIDRAIEDGELATARWGASIISLRNGRALYSRNADKLFTPASNMKLFTTGVALDLLGADYRWRTSVYANAQPDANGAINGDLVLYGRGAPDLRAQSLKENNASLAQLADDLYSRGLRHVQGNVIGDESYFRGQPLGDGWQWTDIQWSFGAEASALSIDGNEIYVSILTPDKVGGPPVVNISNSDGYVSVLNNIAAVKRGERMTLGIHRGLSDNNIRVWGEFPTGARGYGARLSVYKPALWATRLFVKALSARGITVEGVAQTRDARTPPSERFEPSRSFELAFVSSKPLSEITRATNKESINLNAELILRTLGRERSHLFPVPEPPGRERGDEEAGLAVIRVWLTRAGISTRGMAIHDGSGLSRLNLITPESLARLLVKLSKTSIGPVFLESLPIAGRDGTLGSRLSAFSDRVYAKTGLLTYDAALSGYVTTAGGEILAFSIICNDQTVRTRSSKVIDQIVSILARQPKGER